jgi:hypothetical protein
MWAAWSNCSWVKTCSTAISLAWIWFIPWLWDGLKIAGRSIEYADEWVLLAEKLAKEEAISRIDEAVKIMWEWTNSPLSNQWWFYWNKYSYMHKWLNWKIEVHFMKNNVTWEITQIKVK